MLDGFTAVSKTELGEKGSRMKKIDPTARVAGGAQLGGDVSIGPFCLIGPNVVLGTGVKLISHVHVAGHTTIGGRTVIYPFASLGTPPQSVKYKGGPTRLVVGSDCDIRENVTMNIGTGRSRHHRNRQPLLPHGGRACGARLARSAMG